MEVSTKRTSIALASTLVAAGLVVGGVVSTSDAATSTTAPKAVTISGMAFHPSSLTVKVGTSVKWTNKDFMTHSVTWNSTKYGLKSKVLNTGTSLTVTFSKPGTYLYHCIFHPMSGKVVVTK
jgi:plastocyanin